MFYPFIVSLSQPVIAKARCSERHLTHAMAYDGLIFVFAFSLPLDESSAIFVLLSLSLSAGRKKSTAAVAVLTAIVIERAVNNVSCKCINILTHTLIVFVFSRPPLLVERRITCTQVWLNLNEWSYWATRIKVRNTQREREGERERKKSFLYKFIL